ncbi:MAG: signal transduction histidine kinase [Ignavibacteria bacterium]|nr:signal transduction histidine kinase [Ignavibacteria bacterium]
MKLMRIIGTRIFWYSLIFSSIIIFPSSKLSSFTNFISTAKQIDSLKRIIAISDEKTRIDYYIELADMYIEIDLRQSKGYADTALYISKKLNLEEKECFSLLRIAESLQSMGFKEDGFQSLNSALEIFEKSGNIPGIHKTYLYFGTFYHHIGQLSKEYFYLYKALHYFEDVDDKGNLARVYSNFARIYFFWKEYTKAFEFAEKALELHKKLKNYQEVTNNLVIIGGICRLMNKPELMLNFINQGFALKVPSDNNLNLISMYALKGDYFLMNQINQPDSALICYFRAINAFPDTTNHYFKGDVYTRIAFVYNIQNKYVEQLKYNLLALNVRIINGSQDNYISSLLNLSSSYQNLRDDDKALYYFQLGMSEAVKASNFLFSSIAYKFLADFYEKKKNFSESLINFKKYLLYKDSLENDNKKNELAFIQTDMEYHFKEIELKSQNQKLIISIVSTFALILTIFVILLFRSNSIKIRVNKELARLNNILEVTKEHYRLMVENQSDMIVKADNQSKLLFASPSFYNTFSVSENEIPGLDLLPLICPDKEVANAFLNTIFTSPFTSYLESTTLTINGKRWYAWNFNALILDKGKSALIIGAGRDITESKTNEEQLKELNDTLENKINDRNVRLMECEQRYKDLLDCLPCMVLISVEDKIVYGNKMFTKIFDYSFEETLTLSVNNIINEKYKKRFSNNLSSNLKGEETSGFIFSTKNNRGISMNLICNTVMIEFSQKPAILILINNLDVI